MWSRVAAAASAVPQLNVGIAALGCPTDAARLWNRRDNLKDYTTRLEPAA